VFVCYICSNLEGCSFVFTIQSRIVLYLMLDLIEIFMSISVSDILVYTLILFHTSAEIHFAMKWGWKLTGVVFALWYILSEEPL